MAHSSDGDDDDDDDIPKAPRRRRPQPKPRWPKEDLVSVPDAGVERQRTEGGGGDQRDRPQVPPRPQAPVQNRSTNVPPPRPPPAAPDADTAARSFFPSPPQTKTRPSRRQESAENDAATSSHSVHTPDQGPAQPRQTHRAPRTPALPPAAGSAYLFLGGQPHPTQSVKHRYGKSQRLAPVRARRGPSFSDEEDNARVDHRPNRGRATDRTEPVQEGTERRPRDGVSTTKKRGRDKEARLDLEADGRGAARPQKKLRLDDGKTVPRSVFPRPGRPRVVRNPPPPIFPSAFAVNPPTRIKGSRPTKPTPPSSDARPEYPLSDFTQRVMNLVVPADLELDHLGTPKRTRKRRRNGDENELPGGRVGSFSVRNLSGKKQKVVIFGGTTPVISRPSVKRQKKERKMKEAAELAVKELEMEDVSDGPLTPPPTDGSSRPKKRRRKFGPLTSGKHPLPARASPPPARKKKAVPLPPPKKTHAPSRPSFARPRPVERPASPVDDSISPADLPQAAPPRRQLRRFQSESIESFHSTPSSQISVVPPPKKTPVARRVQPLLAKPLRLKSVDSTTEATRDRQKRRRDKRLNPRDEDEAEDDAMNDEPASDTELGKRADTQDMVNADDDFWRDVDADVDPAAADPVITPGSDSRPHPPLADAGTDRAQRPKTSSSRVESGSRPSLASLADGLGQQRLRSSIAYLSMEEVITTHVVPHAQAAAALSAPMTRTSSLGNKIIAAAPDRGDSLEEDIWEDWEDEDGGLQRPQATPVPQASAARPAKRIVQDLSDGEEDHTTRRRTSDSAPSRSSNRLREKRQTSLSDETSVPSPAVVMNSSGSRRKQRSSSSRMSSTFKAVKSISKKAAEPQDKTNTAESQKIASGSATRGKLKKPLLARKSTSTDHVSATPSPPGPPAAHPPVTQQPSETATPSVAGNGQPPPAPQPSTRPANATGPNFGRPSAIAALVHRRPGLSVPSALGQSQGGSDSSSISSSAQRGQPLRSSLKRTNDTADPSGKTYPPDSMARSKVRRSISWAEKHLPSAAEQRTASQQAAAAAGDTTSSSFPVPVRRSSDRAFPVGAGGAGSRSATSQAEPRRVQVQKPPVQRVLSDIPPLDRGAVLYMAATSSPAPAPIASTSALARTGSRRLSEVLVPASSLPSHARTPNSTPKRGFSFATAKAPAARSPSSSMLRPLPPPPPVPRSVVASESHSSQSNAPGWRQAAVATGFRSSSPVPGTRALSSNQISTPSAAAVCPPLPRDEGSSPSPRRSLPGSDDSSRPGTTSGSSRKGPAKSVRALSSGPSTGPNASGDESEDEGGRAGYGRGTYFDDAVAPPVARPPVAQRDPADKSSRASRGRMARKRTTSA